MRILIHAEHDLSFATNAFLLETILQNIIDNAIKYQDPAKENPFLDIVIEEHDRSIFFKFWDNGIGIDTNIQDKVFDMYYRGTYVSHGSGLGLYLVKKATEKIGGTIQLTSTLQKGTEIILTLPKINRNPPEQIG